MLAACCWRLTGSRKSKCNAPHESRQPTARAPVSPPTCSVLFHWASLRTARRTSRRYARPYLTGITPGQASLRYAYMPVSIKAIPARQISRPAATRSISSSFATWKSTTKWSVSGGPTDITNSSRFLPPRPVSESRSPKCRKQPPSRASEGSLSGAWGYSIRIQVQV